jgi:hypothetical protein
VAPIVSDQCFVLRSTSVEIEDHTPETSLQGQADLVVVRC